MKKIEGFVASAPKIKLGTLEYCLWVDEQGALYVQIFRNLTNTTTPGTHSKLLFRVADYLNDGNAVDASQGIRGINPETFREETSKNNDDPGFIKAIVTQLLP